MALNAICNREAIALNNRQRRHRLLTTKTLLVMQLTTALLLVFALSVSARSSSQTITLSAKDMPLQKVFSAIKQQTGYLIVGNKDRFDASDKVNVDVSNMSIADFLELVLKDKPYDFEIRSKTVFIKKKLPTPGLNPGLFKDDFSRLNPPPIKISGTIVGFNNQPLSGATVRIKGKNIITTSDEAGNFELIAEAGSTLIISYVGFRQKELKLVDDKPITVGLLQIDSGMDTAEVVLNTGYQKIRKGEATGSFVRINNEMLNRATGSNILDRIYDIASGLYMDNNSGIRKSITVRSKSSINESTNPLIVLDNFPFEGDINSINPNDVENITLLKDAAAAAIWGARAGNGVIVITTKKGKLNHKLNIAVVANTTFNAKPNLNYIPWLSSAGILEFQKLQFGKGVYNILDDLYASFGYFPATPEAVEIMLKARREGIADPATDPGTLEQLDKMAQFDVKRDLKRHFMRTGLQQQYNVNMNGGNEKFSFYGSIGYDSDLPVATKSKSDRWTLNINNNIKISNRLDVSLQLMYVNANSFVPDASYQSLLSNQYLSPYARLDDEKGNPLAIPTVLRSAYVDTARYPALLDWKYRPLEELNSGMTNNNSQSRSTRINGSIRYAIFPWLKAEFQYQRQYDTEISKVYASSASFFVRNGINRYMDINADGTLKYPWPLGDYLRQRNFQLESWNSRGSLTIEKSITKHRIDGILGTEYREMETESNFNVMYGYDPQTNTSIPVNTTNRFKMRPVGAAFVYTPANPTGILQRYGSFFSNFIYNYDKKYFFSISGRVDQSNNFGLKTNLRKTPLWSLGAGWVIHEEQFLKAPWINLLKLRASYGHTGNPIINATSFATIAYNNREGSTPPRGINYAEINTPNNPGLKWERINIINAGIDIGILNNKISGTVDLFWKKGLDLVGPVLLDPTSGFPTLLGNQASTRGGGFDVNLTSVNLSGIGRLKWSTNLIFSCARDKVTNYYEEGGVNPYGIISTISFQVGYPINSVYSFRSAELNPENGDPRLILGDTISAYDQIYFAKPADLIFFGAQSPLFFGSLINNVEWKNFTLSLLIRYKFKYYFRRSSVKYFDLLNYGWTSHRDFDLRWKAKGNEQFTNVPSLPETADPARDDAYLLSDKLIEKGDHIRLQDIKVSYMLNNSWLRSKGFASIQFYAYLSNLGLLWKANKSQTDPDYYLFNSFPEPKRITIGLNVSL